MGICDFLLDAGRGFLALLAILILGTIFESGHIKEGLIVIAVIAFFRWLRKD